MTAAFNLSQLANNLNTSGQLDATDGLSGLAANANLASSGTPSSSTYLRGDRTWAALPALGKILQVVSTTKSDQFSVNPGNTYYQVPGLSATITPSSSSSRIMVMVSLCYSCYPVLVWAALTRNGSLVGVGDSAGSRAQATFPTISGQGNNGDRAGGASITYVDSPGTTSALTYAVNVANESGPYWVQINSSYIDSNTPQGARSISTITLLEIGA